MMRFACIPFFVFLLLPISAPAQTIVRNGNWWNAQSTPDQLSYLLGFIDGMAAGYDAAGSALVVSVDNIPDCKTESCYAAAISMNRRDDAEISKDEDKHNGITVGQLYDGLMKIYSDYRNRDILVSVAEEVVFESIRGANDAEIERRLEYFRKHPN